MLRFRQFYIKAVLLEESVSDRIEKKYLLRYESYLMKFEKRLITIWESLLSFSLLGTEIMIRKKIGAC